MPCSQPSNPALSKSADLLRIIMQSTAYRSCSREINELCVPCWQINDLRSQPLDWDGADGLVRRLRRLAEGIKRLVRFPGSSRGATLPTYQSRRLQKAEGSLRAAAQQSRNRSEDARCPTVALISYGRRLLSNRLYFHVEVYDEYRQTACSAFASRAATGTGFHPHSTHQEAPATF